MNGDSPTPDDVRLADATKNGGSDGRTDRRSLLGAAGGAVSCMNADPIIVKALADKGIAG
jgi:hypothetical protein